jgi:hypothetical protein
MAGEHDLRCVLHARERDDQRVPIAANRRSERCRAKPFLERIGERALLSDG